MIPFFWVHSNTWASHDVLFLGSVDFVWTRLDAYLTLDKEEMTDNEPICIAMYLSEFEAEMAKMKLELNGIESFITKDDCGGMQPYLQALTGVRLMVRATDAKLANKLVTQETTE